MKYYIIAGEASGDLHGSNFIKALKQKDQQANIRAWGGDLMASAGATIVKHYKELAFMGFIEVIMNLKTILRNIKNCKKDIETFQPDALILIDYPGFNLRIAKWAKEKGIPVHYYIAPQAWAWKESRVKSMKKTIDFLYVILPFEVDFFTTKHKMPVDFIGHPLLDVVNQQNNAQDFKAKHGLNEQPIIALLPGSRKQEIKSMLDIMLSVASDFKEAYQIIIAGAPAQDLSFYQSILKEKNYSSVKVVENETYALLQNSFAALVTSGTATLETALFNVPEVVCYRGNKISYLIAKQLVKIKYISLVNLILDKEAVEELIQDELNKKQLKQSLDKLLNATGRNKILADYKILHTQLGQQGASNRLATLVYERVIS